ncbi:MAG: Fizzy-related protein [Marteilia pararefringens]
MISPIKLNHGNRMVPMRDIDRFETFYAITSPKKMKSDSNLPSGSIMPASPIRNSTGNSVNEVSLGVFNRLNAMRGSPAPRSVVPSALDHNGGRSHTPSQRQQQQQQQYLPGRQQPIEFLNSIVSSVTNSGQAREQAAQVAGDQQAHFANNNLVNDTQSDSNQNNEGGYKQSMHRKTRRKLFSAVLKNELLDAGIDSLEEIDDSQPSYPMLQSSTKTSLFRFTTESPTKSQVDSRRLPQNFTGQVSRRSQLLLDSPQKLPRVIQQHPYKILDAPDLQDDFYLNLLDWSAGNLLSVGLGSSIYLWDAHSSQVTCLGDLSGYGDVVTSVKWCPENPNHLAVGSKRGNIYLWDVEKSKSVKFARMHTERIGVICWKDRFQVTTGSRDRSIAIKDIRCGHSSPPHTRLSYHTQEVCGLDWSNYTSDRSYLASGGNDNQLCVWSSAMMPTDGLSQQILNQNRVSQQTPQVGNRNETTSNNSSNDTQINLNHQQNQQQRANQNGRPLFTFSEHIAAIKAIGWSKTRENILASGGGTSDRHLRIWDITTGTQECFRETGSQICSLLWSKNSDELVTAQGYSKNHIAVWEYPSLTQIATLSGHTSRVLFLAGSPCGKNVVSGAGDETLRFWSIFEDSPKTSKWESSYGLEMLK